MHLGLVCLCAFLEMFPETILYLRPQIASIHVEICTFPGSTTFYMSLYGAPTKFMFKMASLAVTWMLSLNVEHTKDQRSGQAYHTVLQRMDYCSSRVIQFV